MSISFWNKNTHQETVLGGISGIFDRTKNGLVPHAPSDSGTSKYLREDGNWTVPPNDTKGNVISTYAAQSGAAQSAIATVINDAVHMDDAIKTLLNNDVTLNKKLDDYEYAYIGNDTIGANVTFCKRGKTVVCYHSMSNLDSTKSTIRIGTLPDAFKPKTGYGVGLLLYSGLPYTPIGSIWVSSYTLAVDVYKPSANTTAYIWLEYETV